MMNAILYRLMFLVYRILIRPLHRTRGRWTVIVFTPNGEVIAKRGPEGHRLPSGDVIPGYSIPEQCRRGLGLDRIRFAQEPSLRLVGIVGKGREGFMFYYTGSVGSDRFGAKSNVQLAYLDRTELKSLIPPGIDQNLAAAVAGKFGAWYS